jgi:geranylgeranyl diphosphate synthase type II
LHRPSSAAELGLSGALAHFDRLMARALNDIPRCEGAETLRALVRAESDRLLPADTVRSVAQAAA